MDVSVAEVMAVSFVALEYMLREDCDSSICGSADSVVYVVVVLVTMTSAGLPPKVEKSVGMPSVCALLDLTTCEGCESAAGGGACTMVYDIVVIVTVVSACWSPKVEKDVGWLSVLIDCEVEYAAIVFEAVDDATA